MVKSPDDILRDDIIVYDYKRLWFDVLFLTIVCFSIHEQGRSQVPPEKAKSRARRDATGPATPRKSQIFTINIFFIF